MYDQIIGNRGEPFAQGLHVGWVVIGKVCIGKVHPPKEVNVNKTTFSILVVLQRFLYVHIRLMLKSPSVGLKKRVFRSKDGLVRKLELRVVKDGKVRQYACPISEVVIMRHD